MKLNKEEEEILESYERGEWVPVKDFEAEKARLKRLALNTVKKDARVNIRISSKDLNAVKRKALEEGMPYQTLLASVIHKFVSGRLKERD